MRILCLRVARRALGLAVLHDDKFEILDGRHLGSDREDAERTVQGYLERFLTTQHTRGAVLLAPAERYATPTSMLRVVQTLLVKTGVSIRVVHCDEMFQAFGHPPLKNRQELQRVAGELLPDASAFRGAARPYVLEAAALALYADTLFELLARPA